MDMREAFNLVSDVVFDAYFLTDENGLITEYNRMFYSLFPKSIARKLKGTKLTDVMQISVDVVSETINKKTHIRLDEIDATVTDMDSYRFLCSGIPINDSENNFSGVLVLMRNVTDEAMVQLKYQEMLETEAKTRELLRDELKNRTESLVQMSQKYFALKEKIRMRSKGQLSPFMYKVN